MNTMYNLVLYTIDGMAIGDTKEIPLPDNIKYYRKYLSEISKREGKKFTTKIVDNTLQIMRVKYFNIYSKEVQ